MPSPLGQPKWGREGLMGLCLGVDLTLHGEWKSWCPQMAILPMSLIICRAPVIGKEQVGLNLGDIDISDYNTDSLCSSKSYIEILTPGTCECDLTWKKSPRRYK